MKKLVTLGHEESWRRSNAGALCRLIKFKETILVLLTMIVFGGCQSGLYRITTSEDGKEIDDSVRYYEINPFGFGSSFIINDGSSPDGVLYDEDRMPIQIIMGRSQKELDKRTEPGLTGMLWMFSLGVFPMCRSEYVTQDITVKSPIGERSGSYRVDAKYWEGLLPIFAGYPGSADERCSRPTLPNKRIEGMGKNRLVKNLVGEFSYKDYVSFAHHKNEERKAEIARIKAVSEKIDGFLEENKFGEAVALIDRESEPRIATQGCDPKSWAEMRERVTVAHQTHDRKHTQTLIATGKYEDAISFCDSTNSLSKESNAELMRDAVKTASKELNDAERLVSLLTLVDDVGARDCVVMKLRSLNSLFLLTKEQLVEVANTSEQDDVIDAAISAIGDKNSLVSLLGKTRSANVLKTLLEKIADADAVRAKILASGSENDLCVYVSVFGSDEECRKLIKVYPNLLTDVVIKELKTKTLQAETESAIDELRIKRIVDEISLLHGPNLINRIKCISESNVRYRIALALVNEKRRNEVLNKLHCYKVEGAVEYLRGYRDREALDKEMKVVVEFMSLLKLVSTEDLNSIVSEIRVKASQTINFAGYYIGMSMPDYIILSYSNKCQFPKYDDFRYAGRRLLIRRTLRYQLFEKEDGEFWSAFMREYIPVDKKKSLSQVIGDALDSGTYDYQRGYDDRLEEWCYIYKSMKYGTRVIFGEKTGTLVLEEYK